MKNLRPYSQLIVRAGGILCIATILVFVYTATVLAGALSSRSNTLSTSAPSVGSNHTISFTTASPIPVSGKVVATPASGAFTIPASLDYTDIDLTINGNDIPLAATPGNGASSAFGVSITSGSSGSITITLNDTDTVAVGATVVIAIGANAVYGAAGDQQITNPTSIGSYTLDLATTTSGGATIDSGAVGLAIANQVGVSATKAGNSVDEPSISPAGGTFTNDVTVTISTTTASANIYYTTDSTTPTAASTLYTGPFTITQTTIIKAIGIKAGLDNSTIASVTITINRAGQSVAPFPITYTNNSGNAQIGDAGATLYHTCQNGAILEAMVPPQHFANALITITCLPWQTIAPQDIFNTFGPTPGDTAFGVIIRDASGQILRDFSQPIIIRLTYPVGQLAPFANSTLHAYNFRELLISQAEQLLFVSGEYTYSLGGSGTVALLAKQAGLVIPCAERPADLNCDGRVNIQDLSIMMAVWQQKRSHRADINKDNNVNIVDLGILFYWWTG